MIKSLNHKLVILLLFLDFNRLEKLCFICFYLLCQKQKFILIHKIQINRVIRNLQMNYIIGYYYLRKCNQKKKMHGAHYHRTRRNWIIKTSKKQNDQ